MEDKIKTLRRTFLTAGCRCGRGLRNRNSLRSPIPEPEVSQRTTEKFVPIYRSGFFEEMDAVFKDAKVKYQPDVNFSELNERKLRALARAFNDWYSLDIKRSDIEGFDSIAELVEFLAKELASACGYDTSKPGVIVD